MIRDIFLYSLLFFLFSCKAKTPEAADSNASGVGVGIQRDLSQGFGIADAFEVNHGKNVLLEYKGNMQSLVSLLAQRDTEVKKEIKMRVKHQLMIQLAVQNGFTTVSENYNSQAFNPEFFSKPSGGILQKRVLMTGDQYSQLDLLAQDMTNSMRDGEFTTLTQKDLDGSKLKQNLENLAKKMKAFAAAPQVKRLPPAPSSPTKKTRSPQAIKAAQEAYMKSLRNKKLSGDFSKLSEADVKLVKAEFADFQAFQKKYIPTKRLQQLSQMLDLYIIAQDQTPEIQRRIYTLINSTYATGGGIRGDKAIAELQDRIQTFHVPIHGNYLPPDQIKILDDLRRRSPNLQKSPTASNLVANIKNELDKTIKDIQTTNSTLDKEDYTNSTEQYYTGYVQNQPPPSQAQQFLPQIEANLADFGEELAKAADAMEEEEIEQESYQKSTKEYEAAQNAAKEGQRAEEELRFSVKSTFPAHEVDIPTLRERALIRP